MSVGGESAIKKAIEDTLTGLGYEVTRINAGGYRGRAKGAKKGTPDLHVISRTGRSCWLEVKASEREKLTLEQEAFFLRARASGAFCERVWSVQMAVDAMGLAELHEDLGDWYAPDEPIPWRHSGEY